MIIKKIEYLKCYIIVARIFKHIKTDTIIENLDEYEGIFAIISRKSVISLRQLENAANNLLDILDLPWIKNLGLRFLAIIVGERQIKDALNIARPEDQDSLLIWLTNNIDKLDDLLEKLNNIGIIVKEKIVFGDPEIFADIYGFNKKHGINQLEKSILEKQAILKLNLI
jgi:tRNA threonylcarbamoyladenosine modification (KEOPS) complex Cgi121 subunit